MVLRVDSTPGDGAGLSKLARFVVLLMFISFQVYGLGTISVMGLDVAPWDWASVVLILLWSMSLAYSRLKVSSGLALGLLLSLLFSTWMSIAAFFSPQPERALTLMLIQVRNLLVMLCIGTLFGAMRSLAATNRAIFKIGVALAAIAIVMYGFALLQFERILRDPTLWKPTIGYVLDQGGVLRLIGFARDPNFYSIWMVLAFFSGLTLPNSFTKWAGLSIIGLSLVLAMSRGFAIALATTTVLLAWIALLQRGTMRRIWVYFRSIVVGVMSLVLVTGAWALYWGGLWEFINRRVELAPSTPRFGMWETLLSTEYNVLVGAGLRGAEVALGGLYAHNSYLDVFFETGLLGFLLWALMIGYVSLVYLSRLRHLEWVPWVHAWLTMIVMFASVSLTYHPFIWVMAGVALGYSGTRKGEVNAS